MLKVMANIKVKIGNLLSITLRRGEWRSLSNSTKQGGLVPLIWGTFSFSLVSASTEFCCTDVHTSAI